MGYKTTGVKVICVDGSDSSTLIEGKEYELISTRYGAYQKMYMIGDDSGIVGEYLEKRFKIVQKEDVKVVRRLEDLDGMDNGNSTKISVSESKVDIIHNGMLVTSMYKKYFFENDFDFLKSIGFNFEYKPKRTVEEIMAEVEEVEFKYGEENYKLCYEHNNEKWGWLCSRMYEYYGAKYYNKEQLEKAIEELNS